MSNSNIPTPPIDIQTPSRFSSSSPRNQASNLTSALQQARDSDNVHTGTTPRPFDSLKPSLPRQDSLGYFGGSSYSGSRPTLPHSKSRKESMPGSFMGGMSWGGISVGSFVQDDIMMGGTSPYQFQSPSYHSSSYLPKMEANFWNNLKCCDTTFNDLHELLSHFEEIHSQAPSTFPYRMSMSGTPRRKSSTMDGLFAHQDKSRNPRQNGLHSTPMQQTMSQDSLLDTKDMLPEMDTFGDMEMDAADSQLFDTGLSSFGQQQSQFSTNDNLLLPKTEPNLPGGLSDAPSTTTTPRAPQTGFPNNPMLSSVNTPSFTPSAQASMQNTPQLGQAQLATDLDPTLGSTQFASTNTMPFNSSMLQRLNNDFSTFDIGTTNNNNDMLDLCVAEPAKALYSENGGINTHAFPHFNFNHSVPINNSDENARKLQAHRLASGVGKVPNEEERPFKCPVIGCEKAYKNANGLRYHEKHGHSTQKLKDNGDGSFSIVDPLTSVPYPGTIGMEKEKPYRCDVCGKRYKNLNGLKYHRNHSPPCNPEFSINGVSGLPTDNPVSEAGVF